MWSRIACLGYMANIQRCQWFNGIGSGLYLGHAMDSDVGVISGHLSAFWSVPTGVFWLDWG